MSTTTTITEDRIELTCLPETSHHPSNKSSSSIPLPTSISHIQDEGPDNSAYSVTAVPDGGYGWIVVAGGFTTSFCNNAIINCWGVLQAALLNSTLKHVAPATLSYVGSLGLASGALYGLGAVSLMRLIGCRATIVLGNFLMGLSLIGASFCTTNLPGLFGTYSIVGGIGMSLNWTVNNTVPVQYFSARLGLANGLIKLGGGVGGCVMAVALEALNRRVGIEWTFRIQGLLTWAIGLPAAWVVKDRVPLRKAPFVDLSMFRSATFIATFVASAIGVFALFVPPYYLPLFAQSIGLSPSTGAGLVAAFNACNALGRFIAGPLCDKIGPLNMFVIAMALNAASMLAIWPVSSTLGPLVLFAIINGVANGAYFTTQPTVVAGIFGPGRAAVAMSMSVTGWSVGYLMGAPIAGYLLQAAGGKWGSGSGVGIDAYRPAIFYAGGTATISALCVVVARLIVTRKLRKRV